jgi:hypothetical protein
VIGRYATLRDRTEQERVRVHGLARTPRLDLVALATAVVLGALLLAAILATLAHETVPRTGTNGTNYESSLSVVQAGTRVCQREELLPADTAAVRLIVPAQLSPGPRLRIELRRRGRLLARTSGVADARHRFVVAPIPRTTRDVEGVTLCYTVGANAGLVAVAAGESPPGTGTLTIEGVSKESAIPIEYLRGGPESWWSQLPTIVRRIAIGKGDWGGAWVAWAAAACVLCALALGSAALWRTVIVTAPRPASSSTTDGTAPARAWRRVPALGWAILAIGVLNALAWSFIVPPFQVPDEQTHVAYAQQIAEAGRPPVKRGEEELAPELAATMLAVRFGWIGAPRRVPGLWSSLQQQQLERVLHAGLPRHGNDDAGAADPEPPFYYGLAAIPYKLATGATLLDRITLMRGLSALMAGFTALLMFLFVRECLPGRPWAWTVGGVGAAFVPLFGFVSGGVTPDALLFAVCAALFLALARAFRRGMTMRRAVGIGALLALGAVTKINFYGLVPGAAIAVVLAARMSEGAWNARVARLVATTAVVAVVPFAVLMLLDALVWERTLILLRTPSAIHEEHGNLAGQLSYLWQVYFPRLPGQRTAFPELSPFYFLWVEGFLGRFGWVSVTYPSWAYQLGASALALVALLAARALVVHRAAVRRHAAELVAYLLMAGGLLLLVGMVALRGWAPGIQGAVQGRYALPLLALFALLLALAARGAGERAGRAVGVAIVVLAFAWSVFGQLVTIAYYYG